MNSAEVGWILCSPLPPITYFRIIPNSISTPLKPKGSNFHSEKVFLFAFQLKSKIKGFSYQKIREIFICGSILLFCHQKKKKKERKTIIDQLQAHCFCLQPLSGPAHLPWVPCGTTVTPLLPSPLPVHVSGLCYPGSFSLHYRYYKGKH